MKEPASVTDIWLSVLYVFVLIGLFVLIDLGFVWLLNNVVFNLFNWFNHLSFLWKIFVLIVGGGTLLILMFQVCSGISNIIAFLIFRHIPTNLFTLTAGLLIALGNAVFLIIKLWQVPTKYNFWIIIELLLLSFVAFSFVAIARTKKEYSE